MTRPGTIRLRLIALLSAAWLLPLIRAVRLLDYVIREDTGSINAANDIRFAQSLVISYGFSFAMAVAIAWFLPVRRTRLWILPPVASLLVAAHVVWLAPESVIVFFPTMRPFQPALLSLLIGVSAVLIAYVDHIRHTKAGSSASSPASTAQE
jgi:hypothetical protein